VLLTVVSVWSEIGEKLDLTKNQASGQAEAASVDEREERNATT
jgi:hypothetical protein